jgi:hypothetical protein
MALVSCLPRLHLHHCLLHGRLPLNFTHEEQTLLAQLIGEWVTCALAGHRGECSGRAENPLSNRIWLAFKDFSGNEFDPVMVCKKWAQASDLVKQGRELSPNSVFIGLPSEGDAREVVDAAGKGWPS